ncbi:hypothetical protein GP486_001565 [Trichoglossum hirsutum]|uniref:Protein kinase domain-containing protein n=1 Tax=Trichoglossum hirsutum TaxID=265104 RepID=A0A9P8LGX2_9PEZI|nr:hypothetical protein GP486_001565 [Trichoglossum hirsutum]
MDISRSFDAIDINPVADVSLDIGNSQGNETADETPAPLSFPKNLDEFSKRVNRSLGSINDFLGCLDALEVPGPLMLTNHLVFRIGEGAQFLVYRNAQFFPPTADSDMYTIPVAVKKSKFTLSADQRLDLSTKTARKQIHDMQLEITALQHPRLRNHRNIVNLLGYAIDQDWHGAPLLVLELAVGDLEVFAKDAERRSQWSLKHQLCMDVGAGLDVLHTCSIVHGDLKPKNVLVFENYDNSSGVPFIAKLADFGYSVDEARHKGQGAIEVTIWTQGWEAPEIRRHIRKNLAVPVHEFCKADNYSFGLLVWSFMCLNGSKPVIAPDSAVTSAAVKSIQSTTGMPDTLRCTLTHALNVLLLQNSDERPYLVADLLEDHSESYRNWQYACREYEHRQLELDGELEEGRDTHEFMHDWALPSILPFLVEGLGKSYQHHRNMLNAGQTFAMFLLRSFHDIPRLDISLQINMLLESANKGYVPAQAVVKRVLDSHNFPPPPSVDQELMKSWLINGTSTGSLVAAVELEAMDTSSFNEAMEIFHDNGGYIQFYSRMVNSKEDWKAREWRPCATARDGRLDQLDSDGNQHIHYLAAFGDANGLGNFLDETGADINEPNSLGETALYKACMRGCWRTTYELCRRGADASIAGAPYGVTCLHWLFNFPQGHINEVASMLVRCGGDPNAMLDASSPVVNYHFPFQYPSGTPLHWAVAASNEEAVIALSKLGASISLRNGCDPYIADELVRTLNIHGTAEEGDYSITSGLSMGFSVVDLAASMHDWRMLDCIRLADNGSFNPTAVDEEGYSPFHRLEFLRVGRAARGLRFWHEAFRGDSVTRKASNLQTVKCLQKMGFDINQLTRPSTTNPSGISGLNGLSPLMLAVANCDLEVVDVLLECGADPNLTNSDGYSALMLLPYSGFHCSPPGYRQGIVKSLLNHNAKVDLLASSGMTALIRAAYSTDVTVVNLLLEAGAQISDRWDGLNVLAVLTNYCGCLGKLQNSSFETIESCQRRDSELLAVFQRWVFQGANGDQLEVMEHVDRDDSSLLHYAVAAGLVLCVDGLVQAGANVNAVRRLHTHKSNMQYNSIARYMSEGTPLDIAKKETARIIRNSGEGILSKQDWKTILSQSQQIEAILIEHGGIAVNE